MLKPGTAFSSGNGLAVLAWVGVAASLFVPPGLRPSLWAVSGIAVPALLGLAYALLLIRGMRSGSGGGFGSIAAVRRLFADDAALAAGWLHYLAFDLFIGTWMAQAGLAAMLSPVVILPCLILTFLTGPIGLLAFLVIRVVIAPQLGFWI